VRVRLRRGQPEPADDLVHRGEDAFRSRWPPLRHSIPRRVDDDRVDEHGAGHPRRVQHRGVRHDEAADAVSEQDGGRSDSARTTARTSAAQVPSE
jgi:hypothetical protein